MPIQVSCPSCQRQLRVPDTLLGQRVKCPSCEATFDASEAPPPADRYRETVESPVRPRADDEPPSRPRPRLNDPYDDDDEDDGDDDFDFRRRRRRSYFAPHRGGIILTLGILSIVIGFALCPLIGFVGIAPWTMAISDLRAMREGRMDPTGRGQVLAGMITGIIGTILGILSILAIIVLIAVNA